MVQRTHAGDTPSKLAPKYSGLCKVIKIRGPFLTLRELDTQRTFTANHDSVRRSTLTVPDRLPQPPSNNPQVSYVCARDASANLPSSVPDLNDVRKTPRSPVKIWF